MLLGRRVLAIIIDYAMILCYAGLLFGVTLLITSNFNINIEKVHPYSAQIISFLTISLPTFLYFYLFEIGKKKSTLGKQIAKIYVQTPCKENVTTTVLKRNILKFLPWEFAHTGIHWMGYYGFDNPEFPIWIWALIIIPEGIALSYIISVVYFKGSKTLYDMAAKTVIAKR